MVEGEAVTDRINAIARYVYETRLQLLWEEQFAEIKRRWPDLTANELEAALKIYSKRDWDDQLQKMIELENTAADNEARGLKPNRKAIDALWAEFWKLRESHTGEQRN